MYLNLPTRRSAIIAMLCIALLATTNVSGAPNTVGEFYEDAQNRFNDGDFDGAVLQLKNILQEDPKNLPALVLLGQCYVENGDGPAAESTLNEAVQAGADPALTSVPRARALMLQFRNRELLAETLPPRLSPRQQVELLEVKAEAAMQLNDSKALQALLNEIKLLKVNSPGEMSIRATLAMREGKLEEAHRIIDAALEFAPNHPLTRLSAASLLHVEGKLERALEEYSQVITLEPRNAAARLARIGILFDLNRIEETEADFAQFEKLESKDPRLLFLKAIRAERAGDRKTSREVLDETAKLLEILGGKVVNGNLQFLMIAGVANYHLGNHELAEGYLTRYVRYAAGETQTRRMLATLKMEKGKFPEAIALLKSALDENGDDTAVLSLLARAYSGDGQHQRAAATLEHAVEIKPEDADLRTSLAMARARKGQGEAALATLSEVFDKDSARQSAGMPLVILRMNRGDYVQAEKAAAQLVADEPENLTYVNLHGVTLVGLQRMDEARVLFEKVLNENARFTPAALNLAKLDRRVGELEAASTRLLDLLKESPKDPAVLIELARVSEARGNHQDALKWARDAYKEAPQQFEIAKTLIELLLAGSDVEGARNIVFEEEHKYPGNLHVLRTKTAVLKASPKQKELRGHLKKMSESAEFNVEWLSEIGEEQIAAGFLADAQYTLFKAAQERPRDIALRARIGDIALALGKLEVADEIANKLVTEFADHPAGYALRGDIAAARRQFAESAAFYAQARTRPQGERVEIVIKQHMALRESDQTAAEQVLAEWRAVHPGDVWALQLLAEFAMLRNDMELAKARFNELIKLDPTLASAHNNLANILLKTGEIPKAVEHAKFALEQTPDSALFRDTLGWALAKQSDFKAALPHLRDARTRAASLPDVRYHLAYVLYHLARAAEARKELDAALAEEAEFQEKSEALALRALLGS